jgi:hypothetical protein
MNMPSVCAELRSYLMGWRNYFQLTETPRGFITWMNGCATGCG